MSKINDIIRERKSSYPPQFKESAISTDIIKELLVNANSAPTHKLTEPWRYKVFLGDGKFRLNQYMVSAYQKSIAQPQESKIDKIKNNIQRASCILAIIMNRDPKESVPEWEEVASLAMSVQNIWIGLAQYGLGGYWSSPGFSNHMKGDLKLKENEACYGFFYIGNVDVVDKKIKKGDINDKVEWITD